MNQSRFVSCFLFAVGSIYLSNHAWAAHLDIVPYFETSTEGGYQFSVGRFDYTKISQSPPVAIERNVLVFTGAFGVRPWDGQIVNGDPGWDLPPNVADYGDLGAEYPTGTLPPHGGRLKFNVVADPRLGRNLSYWDGVGTPTFGPVPDGEVLDIFRPSAVPESVTLDGANISKPGFELTTTSLSPGSFHTHTGHVLWGDSTRSTAPGSLPTPGFYLISLNMVIENGTLMPNYPEFTGAVSGINAIGPTFHVILAHGFANGQDEYIYGDPLFEPRGHFLTDEFGNYIEDDFGNWIWMPELDELGNPIFDPVLDEFGNPVRDVIGVGDFILAPEMQLAADWVNANLPAVPEPGAFSLAVVAAIGIWKLSRSRSQDLTV